MTDRIPVEVTNLDHYGNPELLWSRAHDRLATPPMSAVVFLGTSRPDGRPHAVPVGARWHDGDVYFTSGPGTRKARNLATNPACTISISRDEWEAVISELESSGVALKPDRDRAWRDFAGWRVNYDTVLLALARLTEAPPAEWSSDRAGGERIRPPVFRKMR